MAKNKIKKPKKFRNIKHKGAQKLTPKPHTNATKLEDSDLVLIQKCFYKKENANLKRTQLESRIKIAQLEAQNVMQNVQKEIDDSSKEYDTILNEICIKYGINLEIDKFNLDGIITRANPPLVEEVPSQEDEDETELEGDDEEGEE